MKTIGFAISHKENEKRRALVPEHIHKIKNKDCVLVEKGYGNVLGYNDEDYIKYGIQIADRETILKQDIVCDPKIGDAEYLLELKHQTIFGWVHAVQNKNIADIIINNRLTAYAWEDMNYQGRHLFWRNNEIAGEAAILHAYQCHGVFPYNTKVAVLGRGNVARGAIKTLNYMGADITTYDKRTEKLFREEIGLYDVIVNAILWDTKRKDHIIYRSDLKKMKTGSMIIDISCDRGGGIETSIPTTIAEPTYQVDGIIHYVVDHTPSLFYKTTSQSLSEVTTSYLDFLIEEHPNNLLNQCRIIENGIIIDQRIIEFQNRNI